MIPLSQRPAGYLLTINDLTDAVFWAKSFSGVQKTANVPFETLMQFGLAEMNLEVLAITPLFYEWFKKLGDAMYSVDAESKHLLIQWLEE